MPHPLNHKYPIPISLLCLTSHFICVQICHMVNVDVPAVLTHSTAATKMQQKAQKNFYCFQHVQNWSDSLEHSKGASVG